MQLRAEVARLGELVANSCNCAQTSTRTTVGGCTWLGTEVRGLIQLELLSTSINNSLGMIEKLSENAC